MTAGKLDEVVRISYIVQICRRRDEKFVNMFLVKTRLTFKCFQINIDSESL